MTLVPMEGAATGSIAAGRSWLLGVGRSLGGWPMSCVIRSLVSPCVPAGPSMPGSPLHPPVMLPSLLTGMELPPLQLHRHPAGG